MMHLVQSLAALDLGHPLRVAIVTQGAQEVPGYQRALTVSQAPLVGLGRLIPNEHGNLRCQLLDLDAGSCSGQAEAIYKELCLEETENELALREGTWFVPRMDRMRSVSEYLDLTGVTDEALPAFRLHPGESGVIGGLELREVNRPQPGQGQVEIRVVTAALNFRDVLKSLNLYPSDGGDYTYLGDECAGIVTAVGEGVSNVAVGDEVVAVAPGSFGAYVLTRAEVLMPKPRNLDFEEAVTIPITFLTAYYALHELARIQPGETVLIQAAAGGVGLSAIQIAHAAGARVFATAGTPEKRELLRNLGVEHVMDSRSLAFADEVKEVTGGRGVDVVLNSLAGEAIPKGIASLAPYGRFLELGKRDLYQNSKLGLWSFRKNLSFHAIDLSRMLADRPQVIQRILGKIHGHISRGNFHPLPHRVFPVSRIKEAFRYMSQAKHIGKVVISMLDKRVSVRRAEPAAVSFEAAATYLVTGGAGGFGFAVARWLAANGARSVVLTSRSGKVDEDCARAIDELATQGVEMKVLRSDVTDQDDVKALVEQISTPNTPLKGVFHAAMVIDDGMLWQLDAERFRRVMAPKVDGCWNLHLSTLDQPLDHFVLFSSISSLVGNPGQANYVAANSFLDAFAQHRNSMGLPALAVNWGRIGDVGYVARNKNVEDNLERAGFLAIDPEKATEALGRLLAREVGNACVLRVDWRTHKKPAPRFSRLAVDSLPSEGQADERGQVRDSIKKAPESEQALLVFRYVMQQVSHVLGISSKRLDPNKPWNDLGIDSLMAVELQNKVENDLDITIPMVELMQTPTVDKLTHLVLSQLDIKAEGMFLDEPATQPEEENEVLVPLRTGGDQPAIICLHAADGQATIYESFAQALPPGIPVYGVNAILTESGGDEGSLRNVVQQYAEIITQHLEPPYRLFGFSYGGLLAMMVAEELHRAGVVEFVGVVDFNPEMVGARHANVDLLGDIVHGLASFVSEKADFFVKRSYEERQEQARALASLDISPIKRAKPV